jgi:hypothetical protein
MIFSLPGGAFVISIARATIHLPDHFLLKS